MSTEDPERDALTDEEIEQAQGGAGDPEPPREIGRELASDNGIQRESHSDIE